MFHGCMVATVTPFAGERVDFDKLDELVEFHVREGTDAIVPCGTTGESPTLSAAEHIEVVQRVVKASAGRMPVIAGTGSNNTAEAIHFTQQAEKAGVNGALVIVPYYNKPSQEGLYRHFRAVAESTSLPLILYNVPGRTVTSIQPETVARLAEIDNVVAIKEASGSLEQASEIRALCDITILSGEDAITLPLMCVGASGAISVTANLVPGDVKKMIQAWNAGDVAEAQKWHYKLFRLSRDLFIETNPVPVKTAMKLLGRLNGEMRLPLASMSDANQARLCKTLEEYGLRT